MPRKRRLYLPGVAQHVVVRGHNRAPILARVDDFRFMYHCLLGASTHNQLAIHAWVLMHNHLHLLCTPTSATSLPKTMQSVGRRYAQYFNRHYGRSGSLWEGRYKAALVETQNYLLCCYRYIELNPVRARLCKSPADYPYSSYHHNALAKPDKLITPHAEFLSLIWCTTGSESPPGAGSATTGSESPPGAGSVTMGSESPEATPTPDRRRYRALFEQTLSRKDLSSIRRATGANGRLGSHIGVGVGGTDSDP